MDAKSKDLWGSAQSWQGLDKHTDISVKSEWFGLEGALKIV